MSSSPFHDLQSRLRGMHPSITQNSLLEGSHFGEMRRVLQALVKGSEHGWTAVVLTGIQFESTLVELERRGCTVEPTPEGTFLISWLQKINLTDCPTGKPRRSGLRQPPISRNEP